MHLETIKEGAGEEEQTEAESQEHGNKKEADETRLGEKLKKYKTRKK